MNKFKNYRRTQYNAEKVYQGFIKDYENHKSFTSLKSDYKCYKEHFTVRNRWEVGYESFVDFLISLEKYQEALNEWIKLQEEEHSGSITYRESAIIRIMKFEYLLKKKLMNGYFLNKISLKRNQLTQFGKRNIKSVFRYATILIDSQSTPIFFNLFFKNYDFNNKMKIKTFQFEYYEQFFQDSSEAKKIWAWYDSPEGIKLGGAILKNGETSKGFVYQAIREYSSKILRKGENDYRISIGAKKIGESWISETELYYKLKKHFKKIEVIQHGRPNWLGRQHFDVWMPSIKVAIEFQGKQHDEPIEFFGGEKSFNENKKRDKQKKEKCLENKVCLIEVREGYNFKELVKEIMKYSC